MQMQMYALIFYIIFAFMLFLYDSLCSCSSELLHNTDFKTFTPKYLDAYSYLDISMVSQVSGVLCIKLCHQSAIVVQAAL